MAQRKCPVLRSPVRCTLTSASTVLSTYLSIYAPCLHTLFSTLSNPIAVQVARHKAPSPLVGTLVVSVCCQLSEHVTQRRFVWGL